MANACCARAPRAARRGRSAAHHAGDAMLSVAPLLALLAGFSATDTPPVDSVELAQSLAEAREMATANFAGVSTAMSAVNIFMRTLSEVEKPDQRKLFPADYEAANVNQRALCEVACTMITATVGESEAVEERAAARETGAIKHVIRPCMSDFARTETVCEACVAALHAMSKRYGDDGKESLEQMFQLDVVQKLVGVLYKHPSSRAIAEHGVHLLAGLVIHEHLVCSENRYSCLSKQFVVNAGAIPAICHALQQFPGESQVQQWGMLALRALGNPDSIIFSQGEGHGFDPFDVVIARPKPGVSSWVSTTRGFIADQGAVGLAVVAMELHPGIVNLQENGCWLISMMATHSRELKESARSAGAMGVALAAMHAHSDRPEVQVACLSPLVAMMGPSGWTPAGWDAAGNPVSESGAQRNELYSQVQGPFTSPDDVAWRELSCDPDHMSPGIVQAVAQAMRIHPHETVLQHAACVALGTLVAPAQEEGEQVCKREARAASIPTLLVEALRANRGHKQIAVECTKAVAELIGTPQLADRFLARDLAKAGALREIVEVMNTDGSTRAAIVAGTLLGDALGHYLNLRQLNCCRGLRSLHAGGDDLHKLLVQREEWWVWCENFARDDISELGFVFGQALGYGSMVLVIYLLWRLWSRRQNPQSTDICARCVGIVDQLRQFCQGQNLGDPPEAKLDKRRRKQKKHAR